MGVEPAGGPRYSLPVDPRALRIEPGDDEAFVFRYVAEEGALGVFVPTTGAPEVGANVAVQIGTLVVTGVVGWRNDDGSENPGAGVVLDEADDEHVDALLQVVRAIAYLPREQGS